MQSDDFAENEKLFLSPRQKLPLGIPVKKSNNGARDDGKGEARSFFHRGLSGGEKNCSKIAEFSPVGSFCNDKARRERLKWKKILIEKPAIFENADFAGSAGCTVKNKKKNHNYVFDS